MIFKIIIIFLATIWFEISIEKLIKNNLESKILLNYNNKVSGILILSYLILSYLILSYLVNISDIYLYYLGLRFTTKVLGLQIKKLILNIYYNSNFDFTWLQYNQNYLKINNYFTSKILYLIIILICFFFKSLIFMVLFYLILNPFNFKVDFDNAIKGYYCEYEIIINLKGEEKIKKYLKFLILGSSKNNFGYNFSEENISLVWNEDFLFKTKFATEMYVDGAL